MVYLKGKEKRMYATYRLKADELTEDFVKILKESFRDKDIEIIVQESEDETEYLLGTEANRKHLLEAIEAEKSGKSYRSMSIEEMEAMVQ